MNDFNLSGVNNMIPHNANQILLTSKHISVEKEIERGGFSFWGMPVTFATLIESLAKKNGVSLYYRSYGESGFLFKRYGGEFVVKGKLSNIEAFTKDFNRIEIY